MNKKEEETLIEDLKYEKQMDKLEPWIKALYKQTEKDPNNSDGWSKWSLRPSKKVEYDFSGTEKITYLDGGNRQEYLDGLIKLESNENLKKYLSLICLTEEEKKFILLCNQVLGLEITGEEFLEMSSIDRQGLYDLINGL